MKDFLINTYRTLMQQKMRSIMTAFGVFWGMFILVVVLGVGKGVAQGGVGRMLKLPYLIEFYPQPTSMEYNGLPVRRKWRFDDRGVQMLEEKFRDQISVMVKMSLPGEQWASFGTRSGMYDVLGISPDYVYSYPQTPVAGRDINDIDVREKRKVCVLGEEVAEYLEAEVGDNVNVNGVSYLVVGVTRCTNKLYAEDKNPSVKIYLPVTTAQLAFGAGTKLDGIEIFTEGKASAVEYQPQFEQFFREYYGVHPSDLEAVRFFNTEQFIEERRASIISVDFLTWLVGLGTLIGGLIGISNIMKVSIKERTQEIGIYRALGAQPGTIIRMILAESLMLTLSSGLVGMAAGLYALGGMRAVLDAGGASDGVLSNPYVPVGVALFSLMILVAGGMLSGYIPIRSALKMKAVDALREE